MKNLPGLLVFFSVMLSGVNIFSGEKIIFKDTFNSGLSYATNDLNYNCAVRQSEGAVVSTYTAGSANHGLTDDERMLIGNNATRLNTNLISYISGGNFTLSVDVQRHSTDNGWGSVFITSGVEANRGSSVFGFHRFNNGTIAVYSGDRTQTAQTYQPADLQAKYPAYGANKSHTLKLVSTAGNDGLCQTEFFIDTESIGTFSYRFPGTTERIIQMHTSAGTIRFYLDDLTVSVPDLRTLGLYIIHQ
ncbi:MAG: hypothetical protein WC959_05785 [Kiritimatiellales bacterium]